MPAATTQGLQIMQQSKVTREGVGYIFRFPQQMALIFKRTNKHFNKRQFKGVYRESIVDNVTDLTKTLFFFFL